MSQITDKRTESPEDENVRLRQELAFVRKQDEKNQRLFQMFELIFRNIPPSRRGQGRKRQVCLLKSRLSHILRRQRTFRHNRQT